MNKKIYFLPFLLLLLVLTSCEETKEAGKFDNWKARNVAFMDSLQTEYDEAPNHGGLQRFAPKSAPNVMVYYKDITGDNTVTDRKPLSTESVNYFYRGSYIFGETFDENFAGADPDEDFETPYTAAVTDFVVGFTYGLQNMKEGQRWILYIPYQVGYGENGSSNGDIRGYTTLIFDLTLVNVVE